VDITQFKKRHKPALQQPDWEDHELTEPVRSELATRPPLVCGDDVQALRALLERVAEGEAHVIQSGDCAEDPAESTPGQVQRKSAVLDLLAGTLSMITHKPVVRIGRIAGQYAKPRSSPTEIVNGLELPVYRGHMVNSPEPDPAARQPDPLRMLTGYMAASEIMRHLGWVDARPTGSAPHVWTSHEALLLDYELPMVRTEPDGSEVLTSTHFPWIGERTRQVDGPHVGLLAALANPIACKVGPSISEDELLALCRRLDPGREPGRLTLITRMGAQAAEERLPALVKAVHASGHPVIWLCDPMHGNTVSTAGGAKTRYVETIAREVRAYRASVEDGGGVAGGLHLEATPDNVTECVLSAADPSALTSTSFCDPRLNPGQAVSVVSAWHG
jgi:3-deoxy-7-phosphoheptulonate synthase